MPSTTAGLRFTIGFFAATASGYIAERVAARVAYTSVFIPQPDTFALTLSVPPDVLSWLVPLFVAGCALTFGAYVLLLLRAEQLEPRMATLLVAFGVLLNLVLCFTPPGWSIDLWSYVAQGHLATISGRNPHLEGSSALLAFPDFASQLFAEGWPGGHGPTPYGPLWTHIEALCARLGRSALGCMFLLKLVIVSANLGSAYLTYAIARVVRPALSRKALLAFLFNPLLVIESAAEGHNDIVMVVCILLGVWLSLKNRWVAALLALASGVLIKYIPLLLAPPQLKYLWTKERGRGVLLAALALCVSAALAVLLYARFWAGSATFETWRYNTLLEGRPTLVSALWSLTGSRRVTRALVGAALLIVIAFSTHRLRSVQGWLNSLSVIATFYLLFASPNYWPWYPILPVALLLSSDRSVALWLAVYLSIGARLASPLDLLWIGNTTMQWFLEATLALGIVLPILLSWLHLVVRASAATIAGNSAST
jgi:hypothetical protein